MRMHRGRHLHRGGSLEVISGGKEEYRHPEFCQRQESRRRFHKRSHGPGGKPGCLQRALQDADRPRGVLQKQPGVPVHDVYGPRHLFSGGSILPGRRLPAPGETVYFVGPDTASRQYGPGPVKGRRLCHGGTRNAAPDEAGSRCFCRERGKESGSGSLRMRRIQKRSIIDIGPDGGKNGGEVVFTGTPMEMLREANTLTADSLRASCSR